MVNASLADALAIRNKAKLLCSRAQVEEAIASMAWRINRDYADRLPLLLGVMKGAMPFMSQLMLQLDIPLQVDYVHLTRYGDKIHGGKLQWLAEPRRELALRHVLIVDDILDEGYTVREIINYCRQRSAASIAVAVLVDKPNQRRLAGLTADYIGLQVPDVYVFGYGMDCESYWRNLPGIYGTE